MVGISGLLLDGCLLSLSGFIESDEEADPFFLLNLTIAIGIEAGEELVDLGLTGGGVGILGKANALSGELLNLGSVDFTIAIEIKLVEGLLGGGESSSSSGSDVGLIFCAKSFHLLEFLLSLILSLQLIKMRESISLILQCPPDIIIERLHLLYLNIYIPKTNI